MGGNKIEGRIFNQCMKNSFEQFNQEEVKNHIQEQLENPENLRLDETELSVYDIKPEKQKSEVPTVFVPGRGVRVSVFKYNIETLAEDGRRVISVDSLHGIETPKVEDIPLVELQKIQAIIQSLDIKGIEKADVVAHSEGGFYMVMAALLFPGRIRNIVLIDSAGLIGKDNPLDLIRRFAEDAKIEAKHKESLDKVSIINSERRTRGLTAQFWADSLLSPRKSFQEIYAISQSDIRDILRELKKQGVGISIIHGVDDKGFPMERIQFERLPNESDKEFNARIEKIKQDNGKTAEKIKGNIDTSMIDGLYSVKGVHNEIFLRPDLYTKIVIHALDAMEKKSITDVEKDKNSTL